MNTLFCLFATHACCNGHHCTFRQVAGRSGGEEQSFFVLQRLAINGYPPWPGSADLLCVTLTDLGEGRMLQKLILETLKCKLPLRSFRTLRFDDLSRWPPSWSFPQFEYRESKGWVVEMALGFIFLALTPPRNPFSVWYPSEGLRRGLRADWALCEEVDHLDENI